MERTIIIWANSMYNGDHKLVIRDKNPVWRWFGKWLWFQQRFMVPNLTAIWHPDCSFISQLPFLNFWVQWIKSEIHGPNNSSGRIWTFAKTLLNIQGLNPKNMLFERDSQKDLKIDFESSFVKNSKFGFISKFQIFLMMYFQWFQNCSIHQKIMKI